MTTPDFVDVVQKELEEHDWSVSKLAKRAGIDSSYLGRVLRRERTIGTDACRAVAKALGKSENEYLALAGLAAPPPAPSTERDQLVALIDQMDSDQVKLLARMAEALAAEQMLESMHGRTKKTEPKHSRA
jgi:transcriptional regulator with XRE-family HTH domain